MKAWIMPALAACTLLAAACNDAGDPVLPESPYLDIKVELETFTVGETVLVTVTAENQSDTKVDLGYGSSTCVLGATVWLDDEELPMYLERLCTADYVRRLLDPGERLVESWNWSGDVWRENARYTLPAGTYELAGRGGEFVGEPVTVTIKEPIEVAIDIDPTYFALGETAFVTMTVTNLMDAPVLIGFGSCLINAKVEFEGQDHPMAIDRLCTPDAIPRYIDAGVTWTPQWDWNGDIRHAVEHRVVTLPPGTYRVAGVAGRFSGPPITIEIRE